MSVGNATQRRHARFDLLRVPGLGRVLLWKHSRTVAQLLLLAVAALIVVDGLVGSPLAAKNTATVSAWVHYRGFVVLALLLVGNLFCAVCPFVVTSRLAKWVGRPTGRWPKPLRNKWLAITGLLGIVYAYELFDLWASPWWTAWLVIAYFAAAFVLEALFTRSAFCKYVCPLGTFNFLYSTISPFQITARETLTCRDCIGHECINGAMQGDKIIQQGCQLELYVPSLQSNLDCTLCLDCAKACPHDNVALASRPYGIELRERTWPHSISLALLAICAAFLAVVNAFAMTPPVYRLELALASILRTESEAVVLALVYAVGVVALPLASVYGAAWLNRRTTGPAIRYGRIVMRYAYAFVPIGFAVWLAHYLFHFLTGAMTLLPAMQTFFASTLGWPLLGEPNWRLAQQFAPSIVAIQLLQQSITYGGLVAALFIAWQADSTTSLRRHLVVWLPWAIILTLLAIAAGIIFLLPMEMRGSALSG